MQKFVLLLCHDRSGSNLTRSILNQHPEIYIIPPIPIFEVLFPVIGRYGSLDDNGKWHQLLCDIVALAEANHFTQTYPITLPELAEAAAGRSRSLGQACKACFETIVRKSGRLHGGLKSGIQPEKLKPFIETTGFTHAVFQIRDPRDVALSTVKAARNRAKPEDFVIGWLAWQRNARRVLGETMAGRFIEVQYERLIGDPGEVLMEIWASLGVSAAANPLEFYRGYEQIVAARTSYMWENLKQPLMQSNFEKYYREWNEAAIRRLDAALGPGLVEFGYSPAVSNRFLSIDSEPTPRELNEADKSLTTRMEATFQTISHRLAAADGMTGTPLPMA